MRQDMSKCYDTVADAAVVVAPIPLVVDGSIAGPAKFEKVVATL